MSIVAQCNCGKSFTVDDEHAGRTGKCPRCGEVVRIPKASTDPADDPTASAVPEATPGMLRPAAKPLRPARRHRRDPRAVPALDAPGELESTGDAVSEDSTDTPPTRAGGRVGMMNYAGPQRYQSNNHPDDEYMNGLDWLLIICCGLIGLLVAINYVRQGKPKGMKMLTAFAVLAIIGIALNLIVFLATAARR